MKIKEEELKNKVAKDLIADGILRMLKKEHPLVIQMIKGRFISIVDKAMMKYPDTDVGVYNYIKENLKRGVNWR